MKKSPKRSLNDIDHVAMLSKLINSREDKTSSPKLRLVKPDPILKELARDLVNKGNTEVKMGEAFGTWAESQAIYVQEKSSGTCGIIPLGKLIRPIT